MAHDFAKQRAARANRASRPGPAPWLWLASGVVIGTLASFLVYLATLAPQPQQLPVGTPAATASVPGDKPAQADSEGKVPSAQTPRPQFDFYDILRNTEGGTATRPTQSAGAASAAARPVELPEPAPPAAAVAATPEPPPPGAAAPALPAPVAGTAQEPAPAMTAMTATPPATQKPAGLAMQAGAFSQHSDADRRRGEILLLGYDARVDAVKTADGQTRYRVVVGPFADPQSLAAARRALRDIGIETM